METKLNYTLVGLFVLIMGAALGAAIFWLAVGGDPKVYDDYVVYTSESVTGLNPKAVVRYRGVEVGRVDTIQLEANNPARVEIMLQIERGVPIKEDTRATLTTQGLTGIASIELTGGSQASPRLPPNPGGEPPQIPSGPSLVTRLDNAFTTLVDRLEILLSDDNLTHLGNTLENVDRLTGTLADRSADLDGFITDLRSTSTALARIVNDLQPVVARAGETLDGATDVAAELGPLIKRINDLVNAVEDAAVSVAQTSRSAGQVLEEGKAELRSAYADAAPKLGQLVGEISRLSSVLGEFVDDLDRNPNMLLLGRPPREPGPGE